MNSARLHFLIDVGVGRHVVANIMDHHSRRLQSHFSVFQRGKLRIRGKQVPGCGTTRIRLTKDF